jgi:hypothetical protein
MLYSVGASLSMPWGSGVTGSGDTRALQGLAVRARSMRATSGTLTVCLTVRFKFNLLAVAVICISGFMCYHYPHARVFSAPEAILSRPREVRLISIQLDL